MKVLLCASEGTPFIKTGGLADVIGALPKALKANGVDVRVMLPYYKKIKEKNIASYVGYAYVRIEERNEYVGVFHSKSDDVDYYFIDSERYFNRDGLYGYGDDGERFAYFSFAVLEALKVIGFMPDVLHLNDWQTGLVPFILKHNYNQYDEFRRMKTVYSIHNIQYQGNFPKDIMNILFMPYNDSLEFADMINYMKSGIMEANKVTTVSPTYRNEILSPNYSYGLDYILELRKHDTCGILNGIDTVKYNPLTDKNIYYNYDINNYKKGKLENKLALINEFHINDPKGKAPLFGLVSRLVDQKGIDILLPIIEDIITYSNANFILMGSGDKYYEDSFKYFENRFPDRFKCYIGYSDPVAQKIYAGVDIFLMPSKFEPCGLGQLIALRYGTLPLVRETGGLKDTIQPYNKYDNTGWGFSFWNYSSQALQEVMYLAIEVYNNNKVAWDTLVKKAMSLDYSWNESAKQYIGLYKSLL